MSAVAIAGATPIGFLRKFLYKYVLGYRMEKGASIGFLTFLDAKNVYLGEKAYLKGVFNMIFDVGELKMDPRSKIGCPFIGLNFISGNWKSTLHLKRGARVTWGHYFDLSDDVTIGSMTIIGGKSCEFFTHDMYNGKRFSPIEIGDACYVGSSSKFCPGARVPNRCVVSMGSVVTERFDTEDALLGGVPARVVKDNFGYTAKITYDTLNLPY